MTIPRSSGVTRRAAVTGAFAAGAAVVTAPALLASRAEAAAPMPQMPPAEFYRFRMGDLDIVTLRDGLRAADGPHPTFGADQPAEAVHELMRANTLPETRFANGFTPTLVNTGSELVLFDTGLGPGARENGLGKTRAALQAAGYKPEDVSLVVLTHFHGDHIGGLMEGDAPAYPNARYAAGEKEYAFWTGTEVPEQRKQAAEMVAKLVVPLKDRMTMLGDGAEVVPGIKAIEALGHTPGHLVFEVSAGERRLMLTADTANHFVASLQKPDWKVAFDMDPAAAAETRKRIFDRIAQEKMPFIGYHMPWPSLGFVEKMEDGGFRYVFNSYQAQVMGEG